MTKQFPDALVIIFSIIVLAQLASYVLPAGEYRRVDDDVTYDACGEGTPPAGARVVPDTYQRCANVRALPWYAVLTTIPTALAGQAASIVFFVLTIGGVLRLMRATEAIDAFLRWIVDSLGHRPSWLVGGMMCLFAIGASTYGMSEEMVVLAPLMVTVCIRCVLTPW